MASRAPPTSLSIAAAQAAPYAADVEFVLARAAALSGGGRPNLEHLTAALQALPGGPKAAATDGTAGGSGAPGGGDALTKAQLEETMKQLMAPQSGFNPDESALERCALYNLRALRPGSRPAALPLFGSASALLDTLRHACFLLAIYASAPAMSLAHAKC